MANRCPVICSNTSSIPEVVGNAGEYFDPTSPIEISLAIKKVVFDVNRSADLIDKGAERIKHFSWESCALQTQAVYKALLESTLSGCGR
jgi:glycosyltransferase involved in cell wall biosynthesis